MGTACSADTSAGDAANQRRCHTAITGDVTAVVRRAPRGELTGAKRSAAPRVRGGDDPDRNEERGRNPLEVTPSAADVTITHESTADTAGGARDVPSTTAQASALTFDPIVAMPTLDAGAAPRRKTHALSRRRRETLSHSASLSPSLGALAVPRTASEALSPSLTLSPQPHAARSARLESSAGGPDLSAWLSDVNESLVSGALVPLPAAAVDASDLPDADAEAWD